MNDGHTVVAIDGLKIEPLPAEISGVEPAGARVPFRPIRDIAELREDLGARVMAGFGGVAEYGITVRWDKNFLKLIRLLLERRREFKMFGGVRFGGTLTIDSAFALGFDHIALCAGAGRPTIVPMKNGLAPGVRQASDFLMALQLTGAGKTDSVANLQVRLPVVVIGGGLTAIDTATEALAYYPLQVEKFLSRYEALVAERGEAAVRAGWSAQEAEVAAEFLDHARQLRAERERRRARRPRAGFRRSAAPLGRRHHRVPAAADRCAELHAQSRGGRQGAGGRHPLRRVPDARGGAARRFGCVRGCACRRPSASVVRVQRLLLPRRRSAPSPLWGRGGEGVAAGPEQHPPPTSRRKGGGQSESARVDDCIDMPARTILVAAGTQPNTVLGREDPEHVLIDGKYFQAFDESGQQGDARARHQAVGRARADERRARRPRHQLLRRPASVLCRQRRQGDGERQAGLSGGQPHAGAKRRRPACRRTR